MGPQDGQASQAYSVAYGRLIKALGCQVTQAVNQVADKPVAKLVRRNLVGQLVHGVTGRLALHLVD